MDKVSIAFIGGGNMAQALIGGLIAAGHPAARIRVADPGQAVREQVATEFGVQVGAANIDAAKNARVVVLAVKPQVMPDVLKALADELVPGTLVISVAAGVTLDRLRAGLGSGVRLVRAMPNTPALFSVGMTGLVAGPDVDQDSRLLATEILGCVGQTVWLEQEALIDVVTAVSGSGPAYFFALAEQLALAGQNAGLPPAVAAQLARQTAFGAGTMLARSEHSAGELRARVTSPGGTTQAALEAFEQGDFSRLVQAAVDAAVRRGRELGEN